MRRHGEGNLQLGSNVVELLLPQKRPFLMVDFIRSFFEEPSTALTAGRHISANEAVFDGHFSGLHIWPGTQTVEGLGQTLALLMAILFMRRSAEAEGANPEVVLENLRHLDMGYRLHSGYRSEKTADFLRRLRSEPPWLAIGGSVEMKFLRPVFAGQRLDYQSTLLGEFGDMMRFAVEASVDEVLVAKGTMSGARLFNAAGHDATQP